MDQSVIKGIMTGVGLFLLIGVIGIVVIAFNVGQDTGKASVNKLNTITSDLNEQDYLIYDGMELSGSSVVNAIKKLEQDGKADKIGVKVVTGLNPGGQWYFGELTGDALNAAGGIDDYSKIYTNGDNQYINPSGTFKGSTQRDKNNAIRAIIFTQQ